MGDEQLKIKYFITCHNDHLWVRIQNENLDNIVNCKFFLRIEQMFRCSDLLSTDTFANSFFSNRRSKAKL